MFQLGAKNKVLIIVGVAVRLEGVCHGCTYIVDLKK